MMRRGDPPATEGTDADEEDWDSRTDANVFEVDSE
jgi:hypothetical protein